MSRPSNSQPSQAAMPDLHCWGERSRRRVTSWPEGGVVGSGEGLVPMRWVAFWSRASGRVEEQAEGPAVAHVRPGAAQVFQEVGVRAAGVFEGVAEDRHAVEGALVVDGPGEFADA